MLTLGFSNTLLLTVQSSSDLYIADLESKYWNIGDLGAVPADIGVDNVSSQSVFVFGFFVQGCDPGSFSAFHS